MPQKKNPDILELTRGKTAEVIGNLTAILTTIKGLASGYGRDLQQIKSSIWETSKTSISALLILKSVFLTMKVNEKQMKKITESSNLIALDIAEKLVLEGIPFRVTHKIAGVLVQLAHNSKKPISKLTSMEIAKSVSDTNVDPKIVSKIISTTTVVSSLKDRKSLGSSGYEEQKRMISDRIQKINQYRSDISKRENKINSSLEDLQKQVNAIIR
jgi:argininosuccinate lyase